jgi:hypothetical protein
MHTDSDEKDFLLISRKNTYPQLESQSEASDYNVSPNSSKLVKFYWKRQIGNLTIGFLSLLFHVFVFYALLSENTSNVSKECGDALWNWILSRFILAVLESIFIAGIAAPFFHRQYPANDEEELQCTYKWQDLCLIFLHCIYIIVGSIVDYNAMEGISCRSVLSSASFLDIPLLGIIGYIYLFLDFLVVILSSCAYYRIVAAQNI